MTDEREQELLEYKGRLKGFLVTRDRRFQRTVRSIWPEERIQWEVFERAGAALEYIFTDPPDLLMADLHLPDMSGTELVALVKSENVYRQMPTVLCLKASDRVSDINWSVVEADDFLVRPLQPELARSRLSLTLHRGMRALDANPLTRLPGNTSIIQRIQDLIDAGQEFALAYADLDNFKSFNDRYGFARGDEVLMMTARIIVNTIRSLAGSSSFVGHVGGDDFVFIVRHDLAEVACQRIIQSFDDIVPHFYDPADRKEGAIISKDRQGATRRFPLMTISLAVVVNHNQKLKHHGEASQIASNLKKMAKDAGVSNYVLDKRYS